MEKYFDTVICSEAEWHTPKYPTLNDPVWEVSFDKGSSLVKRNIAKAWVAAINEYLVLATSGGEDEPSRASALASILGHYSIWYRKIRPHISMGEDEQIFQYFDGSLNALLTDLQLGPNKNIVRETFTHATAIFSENPEEALAGATKLSAILADKPLGMNDWPLVRELVAQVSWDIVKDHGSLADKAAFIHSLTAGAEDLLLPLAAYDFKLAAWLLVTAGSTTRSIAFEHEKFMPSLHEALSEQGPELVAACMPHVYTKACATASGEPKLTDFSPMAVRLGNRNASVFDVMRDWAPQYTKLWDIAEATGMTAAAMGQHILVSSQLSNTIPCALPNADYASGKL